MWECSFNNQISINCSGGISKRGVTVDGTQVLTNNAGYHSSTRALAEGMTRFETLPEQLPNIN
jgi:hypothetical protein